MPSVENGLPETVNIGALREAIINATDLEGVFGQNVHESKDVVLRVGDRYYPLTEVSVGFYAPTGSFVMYLTGDETRVFPPGGIASDTNIGDTTDTGA